MTMVANSYLNESRPHPEVIELITLGFIGKLLQWWNNCLTKGPREDIKNAIQKDEERTSIFDECIGRGIPDGVKHFDLYDHETLRRET